MSRTITYLFEFATGGQWRYDVRVDERGLLESAPTTEPERAWTRLDYKRCPNCPLKASACAHCPVAQAVDQVVESAKNTISYTRSKVTVSTPERTYVKECATQEGLRSLIGYLMPTAGCPHFDWLRPLARFHLPFSDLDETLFRVLSAQLLENFMSGTTITPAAACAAITKRYDELQKVNHAFINRIRTYCQADANKNAIAALDTFVQIFSLQMQSNFESLRRYYARQTTPHSDAALRDRESAPSRT